MAWYGAKIGNMREDIDKYRRRHSGLIREVNGSYCFDLVKPAAEFVILLDWHRVCIVNACFCRHSTAIALRLRNLGRQAIRTGTHPGYIQRDQQIMEEEGMTAHLDTCIRGQQAVTVSGARSKACEQGRAHGR